MANRYPIGPGFFIFFHGDAEQQPPAIQITKIEDKPILIQEQQPINVKARKNSIIAG